MYNHFLILLFFVFIASCINSQKTDPCHCLELLISKTNDEKWKECKKLSEENSFIIQMRNCENYTNFIELKLEENYKNLVNPKSSENITIENITE